MSERIIVKDVGDLPDGYQFVQMPGGGFELLSSNGNPVAVDVVEEVIHHDDHHDHDHDHDHDDRHHHR